MLFRSNQMKTDIKTASDSLYALSKKAPQISPKLRKSLSGIQHTIQQSVQNLVNGEFPKSALNMQTTMTELNNIALLLQEGLEAMQQQQRQQMNSKNSKSGSCKKPGKSKGQNPGSKGQLGQARQLQEQLNQQMKQLREQMGKQEGGTKGSSQQMKPSSKSGKGSGGVGTAEQFARMAAQQEAIRLQLLEALQRMKQQGMKAGKDLAEMMENTERELVNKQISPELIQRQQDILTRLLEQEQAEREQDEDFKRESQYKNLDQSRNLKPFLEYKRKKQAEWEPLIETPIHLTPYYRLRLQSILSNE